MAPKACDCYFNLASQKSQLKRNLRFQIAKCKTCKFCCRKLQKKSQNNSQRFLGRIKICSELLRMLSIEKQFSKLWSAERHRGVCCITSRGFCWGGSCLILGKCVFVQRGVTIRKAAANSAKRSGRSEISICTSLCWHRKCLQKSASICNLRVQRSSMCPLGPD